jgi:N-formylglutamate amidohydrolase
VIATAIHAGHELRPDVAQHIALADDVRLREEDPATERIADFGATLVSVHASRFQVDLNRERHAAVYRTPGDAWELDVWRGAPLPSTVAASLAEYDAFFDAMHALITDTVVREGHCIVLDVHSYNHRRSGSDVPPAPTAENPEVNLGTGSLDDMWSPVARSFSAAMIEAGYDVRSNVKFRGGAFPRWVNGSFPRRACAIAIEFKKTYVDEWTGEVDEAAVARARTALRGAAGRASRALGEFAL